MDRDHEGATDSKPQTTDHAGSGQLWPQHSFLRQKETFKTYHREGRFVQARAQGAWTLSAGLSLDSPS